LPILEKHLARQSESVTDELPSPTGLVLVPGGDLAHQVATAAQALGMSVRVCLTSDRHTLSHKPMPALIVATPHGVATVAMEAARERDSRMDWLREVPYVVLDEADLLLGGAAGHDARLVLGTAREAQAVFVAATMPRKGRRSAGAWLEQYYAKRGGG